ncbi:glutamate synthase large subunit [Sediminispirochaeta bajacaliforniensis]|uniref:glutamate synthase large subunit n=1 Tax=Sediminispirochaeta bajacaliforniensis TaxID=148 RepID=UPI000380B740|nr:glutamate synthase large subunit [Sediminispirochaeta bajacaliforniensis]
MQPEQGLYDPQFEHDACGVGFIANIDGTRAHDIVEDSIQILINLEHRGAVGGDMKTGDGAGMLTQIPDDFFRSKVSFTLPPAGEYGVGVFFLSGLSADYYEKGKKIVESTIEDEGGSFLGWREVPINTDALGETALASLPAIEQAFFSFSDLKGLELERRLYICRKLMEKRASDLGMEIDDFYIPSLSSRTIVYKGMFVSTQFTGFYPDVLDPLFTSAISLVHQRYSTNTFPSWALAQPFRYIAHNGEINTLRRNMNNMMARETSISSPLFGDEITKLSPIVNPATSDSAVFDNVFELLVEGGRDMDHAMMMMVPEAFGTRYHISEDKRAFYEYHAAIMEPWDGPAAIVFTDGIRIGATLDRNGLRPGRYVTTKSGKVVLASEAGVLEFPPEQIIEKGRLAPGKMFLVDTEKKRIFKDNVLKASVSRGKPYRRWLEKNKIELKGLLGLPSPVPLDEDTLLSRLRAFGYTLEDVVKIITPMTVNAQEPIGSMGNDAALAVLSDRPQLLYDYFKQMFAQVTNPPIDAYRENLVMSLMSFVGRERNLLAESPEHCRQLKLAHPVLTNDDLHRLRNSQIGDFHVESVPMLFPCCEAGGALKPALDQLCRQVEEKIDEGASLIILSDRGMSQEMVPIPALLAMGAVQQYLVRQGKRHLSGIIIETGEAREVHHVATLVGYGASGVNPYMVFEALMDLKRRGYIPEEITVEQAAENYITAVKKGLLKVMSKMGISTLRSYRGSQIYEALGLNSDLMKEYFPHTPSNIEGIGLAEIERETVQRHLSGYRFDEKQLDHLDSGGLYNYRKNSTRHRFTPLAIVKLQKAVREANYETFKEYSSEINNIEKNLCSLRGLFTFKEREAIPLEEVESAEEIVKRFASAAMSFGSLSEEAHTTIAIAMNRLGAMSNSGEGGEDNHRYKPLPGGDSAVSTVKQIASGRFGVTGEYLVNAKELQIKMAQGAKPGEGGQLPGHKVDDIIARVRHSTPGVMLISPPPHHDIYSIEDLAQLIYDLKHANPKARVSVKLVSEVGVGTIAAGVAKGKADMVLISSGEGGTGASPLSSLYHAGSYWELGLAETQQVLVQNKLRENIRVQVDGQLRTGRDIVVAAMLGAEEFGFGTVTLVSLGCILMRKCHLNSCPVGIATQDERLRCRFQGKPEHLMNFMLFVAREVREIMASLGFRRFEEMVGRSDLLDVTHAVDHYKMTGLDLSKILEGSDPNSDAPRRCLGYIKTDFTKSFDWHMIQEAKPAIEKKEPVELSYKVRNSNRTIGAMLSSEVSSRYGLEGLPEDTIKVHLQGSAGQSFGAFLARGISLSLEGEANDYFGKGLSGGKLAVFPPKGSQFLAQRNIITGNVNLFGATGGEAYINGRAGERFAVRNSGAVAVVEGVGDHGCEYMTGGAVIVLGETGINFAAGMSGGIAYVLDESQLFDTRCNLEMVDVEQITDEKDEAFMRHYIERHVRYTGSRNGARILEIWDEIVPLFVKVIPIDYKKALERINRNRVVQSESAFITEEVGG